MTTLTISQIKKKFSNHVAEFYADITGDMKMDLRGMINDPNPNMRQIIDMATTIKDYDIECDALIKDINSASTFYDLIKMYYKLIDTDSFPFYEQEVDLFKWLFDVEIVEDDVIKLERAI